MAAEVHTVSLTLGDPGADNKQIGWFRAPLDAVGGGITITAAWVTLGNSVTNSLGVGGTTFTLALHKYSNAASPVVNGTISSAAVGGTAVGWTANVPQVLGLNAGQVFVDAGEYVVWQYNEINNGNPVNGVANFQYQMGR